MSVPSEAACARLTVWKDMCAVSWEHFTSAPVKHAFSLTPPLQTCLTQDCKCPKWHAGPEGPEDAVLDVFRRQYFADSGRPVKWDHASRYNFLIRFPKAIENAVLSVSGQSGLFLEPKTEDAMKPSFDFQVIWLPQLGFASVQHSARLEGHCVGLARHGQRFGIRVPAAHFQAAFASLRPDSLFLAPGPRVLYTCGPWPHGLDRKSLAKTLKSLCWAARPLQPLRAVPGGLLWTFQAVDLPPKQVFDLPHGQVIVTRQSAAEALLVGPPQVIGPAATVSLCEVGDPKAKPPGLAADPWLVK